LEETYRGAKGATGCFVVEYFCTYPSPHSSTDISDVWGTFEKFRPRE